MEPPHAADEIPTVRIMVNFWTTVCRDACLCDQGSGTTVPFRGARTAPM